MLRKKVAFFFHQPNQNQPKKQRNEKPPAELQQQQQRLFGNSSENRLVNCLVTITQAMTMYRSRRTLRVSVALVHLEEIWKITRMRAIRCSRVRCTHRPYVVCYMYRHIVAFVFLLDVSIGDPVYLPRIHAQAAVVCHKRRKFPSVNGFFLLLLLLALVLSYYFWFLIEFESHAANSVYFSPK